MAEKPVNGRRTHGQSKTKLYEIWCGIKGRCFCPSNTVFRYYGGRGITLCSEWMSFEAFRDWALSNGYHHGLTIERKNTNGNYEPNNCTWIPREGQSSNRNGNLSIAYNGKTTNLKEWSRILGIGYLKLYKRVVYRKWPIERAFTT